MFVLNTMKSVFFSGDELQYECKEGDETIKKTIGARVVYKCDEGYKMLSQYDYRDCRANGWSNDVPHCEVNKCFPVASPTNGRIVQGAKLQVDDDFLSGDIVIFGCTGAFKSKDLIKLLVKVMAPGVHLSQNV